MSTNSILSTFKQFGSSFYLVEDTIKSVFSIGHKDSANKSTKVFDRDSTSINLENTNKSLDTIQSESSSSKNDSIIRESPSDLCNDIEFNITTCLNQLGACVFDVESPLLKKRLNGIYGEEDSQKNKRVRRRPEELEFEKKHLCPYVACEKSYTSKCSLYLHIKRNHKEFEVLKDGEKAPIRLNSKVKKGVDIYKVFKKAQAIKYEPRAENEDSETSNVDDISEINDLLGCDLFNTEKKTKTSFLSTEESNSDFKNRTVSMSTTNDSAENVEFNEQLSESHIQNDFFAYEFCENRKESMNSDANGYPIAKFQVEDNIFDGINMGVGLDELIFEKEYSTYSNEYLGFDFANEDMLSRNLNVNFQDETTSEEEFETDVDFMDFNMKNLETKNTFDFEYEMC